MNIIYNDLEHSYTIDGFRYPNVTTILQSVGYIDLRKIPVGILNYKRELGSNVHLATQYFDNGILDESTVGEAERPYFDGYKKCIKDLKPSFIEIEKPVASKSMRYSGTPDRVVMLDKKAIWEIKCTAKIEPAAKVQTIAYFLAYNEMNPKEKAKDRYIVHLLGNGDYNLIQQKNASDDKASFLNALGVYNWKEKHL